MKGFVDEVENGKAANKFERKNELLGTISLRIYSLVV